MIHCFTGEILDQYIASQMHICNTAKAEIWKPDNKDYLSNEHLLILQNFSCFIFKRQFFNPWINGNLSIPEEKNLSLIWLKTKKMLPETSIFTF